MANPQEAAQDRRTGRRAAAGAALLAAALACAPRPDAPVATPPTHEYTTQRDSLRMADGTWLAVTWWLPAPRQPGERFPALLELLPYRKDDDFYARDYPLYDWFARRGFLMAKVDVRGTGGSQGAVPDREYSEQELDDATQLIAMLAAHPASNGRVGMWGISWGGFNALQVALRRPPALKAVLAAHASDDLFHDDVRYIDGVLHLDRYALQIDHGNGLPRTPDYALDSAYFADRFDRRPWILSYLAQDTDGPFWRANALRDRRADLRVPAYFIGGLLDGYRDTPWRAYRAADAGATAAPVKVEIGPWNHAWPDNGRPGPNYEWRARAARWWDHWLRDRDTGLMDEPPLLVFQRTADAPDADRAATPGAWRFDPPRAPSGAPWGALDVRRTLGDTPAWTPLRYRPGSGTAAGEWWGEPTGDMAPDDASAIVVDLPASDTTITLLGMPSVGLRVRHGAPLAHWVARLESVAPNGRVALVTGGALNVAHRTDTRSPARATVGDTATITFDLHFTTWTLPPGHRLRVAITNAQFPMLWPTPFPMETAVDLSGSWITLPTARADAAFPAPVLPAPDARARRPDVAALADTALGPLVTHDPDGRTTVRWRTVSAWSRDSLTITETEDETYTVRDADPAGARFLGVKSHRFTLGARTFTVETRIAVQGRPDRLDVRVTRTLDVAGRVARTRTWDARIPRAWH